MLSYLRLSQPWFLNYKWWRRKYAPASFHDELSTQNKGNASEVEVDTVVQRVFAITVKMIKALTNVSTGHSPNVPTPLKFSIYLLKKASVKAAALTVQARF